MEFKQPSWEVGVVCFNDFIDHNNLTTRKPSYVLGRITIQFPFCLYFFGVHSYCNYVHINFLIVILLCTSLQSCIWKPFIYMFHKAINVYIPWIYSYTLVIDKLVKIFWWINLFRFSMETCGIWNRVWWYLHHLRCGNSIGLKRKNPRMSDMGNLNIQNRWT